VFEQQAGERAAGELTPWSVLNISGLPYFAIASSTASVQNAVSIEIDRRHASTRRLCQSITAAK
jgi:hypothetical protein